MKIKQLSILVLALAMLILAVTPALAAKPGFGQLYYDGDIVRTVVPPAAAPKTGRDPLYAFPNGGAEGQLAVAAVAPGDKGYHGGNGLLMP